jgi:uncharacterized membrane protein
MFNPIGIGIGVIYFGLLDKILFVYYKKQEVDKMCGDRFDYTKKYDKKCEDDRILKLNEIEKKIFIPTITICVLSIIISVILKKYNDTLSYGIGLGAILSLIYNVVLNWHRFDDKQKLLTYTISFITLIIVTLKLQKNNKYI